MKLIIMYKRRWPLITLLGPNYRIAEPVRINNKQRKGPSHFISNFISQINAGEAELSCYVDLSKAFDCVDATVLLGK